jgi:hypothetical protein
VERKFGAQILDEVVDPFVAMTMSPAEDLSLAYAVSAAFLQGDAVICATPAREASALIADSLADEARFLEKIPYGTCVQVVRRERAMVAPGPGYQERLHGFSAKMSRIRDLYLISDYQTNPLIEVSVHLAEQAVRRILRTAGK